MSIYDNAGVALIPSGTKASKLYSVLPANGDGDFTHSRGSTATRVNKDGFIESVATNVPRLDYPLIDGVVQDCPALLLEPSRTNQFTYSESLNSGWVTGGATMTLTASQFVSPDGSQNASRLEIPSSGSASVFAQLESHSSGTQYTISIYAKSNTGTNQSFRLYGDYGASGNISSDFTATNEWQRFTYTFTASASGSRGTGIYNTLNEAADLQIYGIQFEQGSYPTSYIPTSGSTATRSADTCNGSGTSAEFNDSEGVLFAEISAFDDTTKQLSISDGTTASAVKFLYLSGNIFAFQVRDSFATQVDIQKTLTDVNENIKAAAKYKSNDFSLWVNGFEIGTDTSGTVPSGLSELAYDDGGGGSNFYSKSKQLMTFKTALTDSELETLTSWDSFNAMAKGQLYTIE